MRRALSLIELLVVLAIIATLIGLLLPAICKVREAAALMKCQNNLKQFGLALHNYQHAHGHFPAGTIPNTALPPEERLSWCVAVLPYIEQEATFKKFDRTAAWDAPANKQAAAAWGWQTFLCPGVVPPDAPPPPFTNYVGVAGIGPDAATLPLGAPGVGLFGYDRLLKPEHIKDGTAQTIALVETARGLSSPARGGPGTVRGLDLSDEPLLGEGRPFGGRHKRDKRFGGTEPLGVQVLMADGTARLSQVHVDPAVLGALATVAGGEEVPAEW